MPSQVTRRGFIGTGTAGFVGLTMAPGRASAMTMPTPLAFGIWREGSRIGSHRVDFETSGTRLISRVEVDIVVKVAFVTAFRFRQRAVDHWQDGVLIRSEVDTDDDGDRTRLLVESAGDGLVVDGPAGERRVPFGLMTDACFWNPAILRLPQLIDAGTGELDDIRTMSLGRERLVVLGREIDVDHFRVTASEGTDGDIWYDRGGRWVQASIRTRGEELDYRPLA